MSDENDGGTNVPTFTTESEPDSTDAEALEEIEADYEGDTVGPDSSSGPESESESGRLSGIFDSLSQTEPHPPLSEVEFTPDLENGGMPRIMRGVNKASPTDGEMLKSAWFDIGLGLVELMYQEANNPMGNSDSDSDSDSEDSDHDTISISK